MRCQIDIFLQYLQVVFITPVIGKRGGVFLIDLRLQVNLIPIQQFFLQLSLTDIVYARKAGEDGYAQRKADNRTWVGIVKKIGVTLAGKLVGRYAVL